MYELIQVSERSYYIQSPAKIGLVRLEGQNVCLIDSGNDKDAGRKVRQLLDANGWRLTAIYNTHSTVRSYLAWLKDTRRMNALFENNMLLWQRV